MSSLNNIMRSALKSTSLQKIRFKRDPGNHESNTSYEGYLLEEDGVSGTATIFVPELMDAIMNVSADSIEDIKPPVESNLCKLKSAAAKMLISLGHVTCELDIKKLDMIESLEQFEYYLNQFEISDKDMLNIYRLSYE